MSHPSSNAPGEAAAREDEHPLEAGWPAPRTASRWERLPRWVRRTLPVAGPGALAVLLWACGGLRPDQGSLHRVPPGTLVHVGPLDISVTDAVASHPSYQDEWRVVVHGSCRNTTDGPIPQETGLLAMAAAIGDHGHVNVDDVASFWGTSGGAAAEARTALAPSDQPSPCLLAANLPADYTPGDHVTVGLSDVTLEDTSVLKTGEQHWTALRDVWLVSVPLVVAP